MVGKHYSFLHRNPREVRLTYDGRDITAGEAFTKTYKGLSPLIQKNIGKVLKPGRIVKNPTPDSDNYHRPYVTAWKTELAEQGIHFNGESVMRAEVKFDDNSTTHYILTPRTNFHRRLLKYPNIIHLDGDDGSKATLREARVNDYSPVLRKLVHQKFENAVDDEASAQFEAGEQTIEERLKPDPRKIVVIPEPHLLEALESLYFNEDLPRITPDIRIVDSSKDRLWYVRDFLSVLQDTEFSPEKMGEYFGVLHGLGLMEVIDRQLIHYAELDGRVVNYDPDFYSFTEKKNFRTLKDLNDFKAEMEQELQTSGIDYVDDDALKQIRKLASQRMNELEKQGITPSHFYGKLPLSLDTTKSNVLSRLHVEQPKSTIDLMLRVD